MEDSSIFRSEPQRMSDNVGQGQGEKEPKGSDYSGRKYQETDAGSISKISGEILEKSPSKVEGTTQKETISESNPKLFVPGSEKELLSLLPEEYAKVYLYLKAQFEKKNTELLMMSMNARMMGGENQAELFLYSDEDRFFKYLYLAHYSGPHFGINVPESFLLGPPHYSRTNTFTVEQFQLALHHSTTLDELFCNLRLPKDVLLLTRRIVDKESEKKEAEANWETYVVRNEAIAALYKSDDAGQRRYGEMMHLNVKIAGLGLLRKWSFEKVFNFLAWRRNLMARILKQPKWDKVGVLRDHAIIFETPLTGIYSPLPGKLKENLKDRSEPEKSEPSSGDSWIDKNGSTYQFMGQIGQEKVSLSTLKNDQFFHMSGKDVKTVLDYVENKLFPEIMAEKDPIKVYEKAGRIFWWLCHAKPYALGDPSVAEMFIRAIFATKVKQFPWKVGLIPWLEASSEPDVNKFSKNFKSLFELPKKS